ncbi:MAG: methyltransferase [Chitinophagales bacterium]
MSDKPFHFKQFSIHQDQCAMKVGTDGVLLGAWAPTERASSILDIGTGTGVMAIMQAQRNPLAIITGIEIDGSAAKQANFNFESCPWHSRLHLINGAIQSYAASSTSKYDHIISNPPFYDSKQFTKAQGSDERILARHTDHLSYEELIKCVDHLLVDDGQFSLIVPISAEMKIKSLADEYKFYLSQQTNVKPAMHKKEIRVLLNFSRDESILPISNSITIQKGKRNEFTEEYIELTKHFYTIL